MTPTNNGNDTGGLYGLDAVLASRPQDPRLRGGLQDAFNGTESMGPNAGIAQRLFGDMEEPSPLAGLGPLLEADDAEAFKTVQDLVMRQEPLALSRLALDTHWTAIKSGYQFSTLTKVQDQDTYQQSFPPGRLTKSAVPNKQADLCHKLVETLLVDPAAPDPQPETDTEEAKAGAEMAREFLRQDGGEAGTDDTTVFYWLTEGATTKASTYAHLWVNTTGGGSVPKQIKAHPQAVSPDAPFEGPDGLPTTDYVLRYVTADNQFTANPSEADRVWLPRICVDKLDRRHVRFFPETTALHDCNKALVIYYCTVGQARQRWPETVGQMDDTELAMLCDWMPPRAMSLLPAVLRARVSQSATADKKGTVNEERLVFWYCLYIKATPEYPQGAYLYLNGARNGTVLDRGPWSATVEMPSKVRQDEVVTDLRNMDIPLVDVTLLQDPDHGDPTGVAVMARIGGPGEASATLATAFLEATDRVLHPARFATATSPLTDDDIEESRAGGKLATVLTKDDVPVWEKPPELPNNTLDVVDWNYRQMDSAIGLNQAAQGQDDSPEVSGVARRIAVSQALVAVSRMQHAINTAWERYWRVKLQLAMATFSVPQMLRYVGPDGAAKQEWFSGTNFALVGEIRVQKGSGTMLPPTEKVNYVLQLRDAGLLDGDEASDVARPAFAATLGAPENPHVQRIERQVSSWLEGPPEGWEEEAATYQQNVMAHAQLTQQVMLANPMAGESELPPQPTAPWTPFKVLPMDAEPPIATIRKRRLARLMAEVDFSEQPEAWQQVVIDAYTHAVQSVQAAAMASAPQAGAQVKPTSIEAGADQAPVAA